MKQRLACRCPACGGVHRLAVDEQQTWGIDVDERARFVIVCKWCLRHQGVSALQLLDRERATRVNVN